MMFKPGDLVRTKITTWYGNRFQYTLPLNSVGIIVNIIKPHSDLLEERYNILFGEQKHIMNKNSFTHFIKT